MGLRNRNWNTIEQSPFIDFASMTDAHNFHYSFGVVDGVNRTVVASPNSPLAIPALQLLAPGWARIGREAF
jgi:hypothetical protein